MKFSTAPLLALGALLGAGCAAQNAPEVAPVAQSEPAQNEPPATDPVAATADTTTGSESTSVASSAPNAESVATSQSGSTASTVVTRTTTTQTKPGAQIKADTRYRVAAKDFGPGAPAALLAALQKAAVPPPPANFVVPAKARVVMQTSRGPITVELDGKAAPLHVKSFLYLASRGFFNGTQFHRHADLLGNGQGFIIQGGDPFSKSPALAEYAGQGGPGYEIPRERNKLVHNKLVIAAARSSDPDSAGSQFYITQGDVPFLDEGDGYTVFGKVVAGGEAALKLQQGDTLKSAVAQSKTTKR